MTTTEAVQITNPTTLEDEVQEAINMANETTTLSTKHKAAVNQEAELKAQEDAAQKAAARMKELKAKNIDVPIDVFPQAIQDFIFNYYNYYQYPIEYYFGSVLTVAGTVIGNAFTAKYQEGWEGVGMLWMNLVGGSSVGKSQAQKHCIKPALKLQEAMVLDNDSEIDRVKQSGNWKPEDLPKPRRLLTSKSTNEQLISLLKKNPKGIMLCRSEGRGWMKSMNQYNNGDDTENFMEWWDNDPWSDDKKSTGYVYIERPFVSVLIGIQTKIVKQMGGGDNANNGFFQRLLFCAPVDETIPEPREGEPKKEPYNKYEKIIFKLNQLKNLFEVKHKNNKAGHERIISCAIPLSAKAKKAFFNYRKLSAKKRNNTESDVIKSMLGKLETYVLRFAIILEMLEYASKPQKSRKSLINLVKENKYEVSEQTLLNAIKVADYFEKTGKIITNKLDNPIADLKPIQQGWYENLPEFKIFKASFGLGVAEKIRKENEGERGLSVRTVKDLYKRRDLFRKTRFGYERIH